MATITIELSEDCINKLIDGISEKITECKNQTEKLLNSKQLAAKLGVSESLVYKKDFPSYKFGKKGSKFYKYSEVLEYLSR